MNCYRKSFLLVFSLLSASIMACTTTTMEYVSKSSETTIVSNSGTSSNTDSLPSNESSGEDSEEVNTSDEKSENNSSSTNDQTINGGEENADEPKVERISKLSSFPRNSEYVKYHGRNYHYPDKVIMNNVGSGFETLFYGTELKAELDGYFGSWYGRTMISVMVDGDNDPTKSVITLTGGPNKTIYTLVKGLEEGEHKVKVLKRTENLATNMSLFSISTDGYFIENPKEDTLKMEVFGDSITAGYGNLRGALDDQTKAIYQDGLETYATLAAFELDADINVNARTGIGLYTCQGYASGNNSLVIDNYNYCDMNGYLPYDMKEYIPDIVLINLGTNDHWWTTLAAGTDAWGNPVTGDFDSNTFKEKYVSFVKTLVGTYGNKTSFIMVSGYMETYLADLISSIIDTLKTQITNKLYQVTMSQVEGHPKRNEHQIGADKIVKLIKDNNLNSPSKYQKSTKTFDSENNSSIWSITPHSNKINVVSSTNNSINMSNSNWMAGFALKDSNKTDDYNITLNINPSSKPDYITNVRYGVLPYYVDDWNYIVVYLQFNSSNVMTNIGCTGMIDGTSVGWLDFNNINNINITNWNNLGEISINRSYNTLTVKYGNKVESKYIPGMVYPNAKIGIYDKSNTSTNFTNITQGDLIKLKSSSSMSTTSYTYIGSGSMETSTNKVTLRNGTWKDGFALIGNNNIDGKYTISSVIKSGSDSYVGNDDVYFGYVLDYKNENDYIILLCSYAGQTSGALNEIVILEYYEGADHWTDFWEFQGATTSLISGNTLTVTVDGSNVTVDGFNKKITKSVSRLMNSDINTIGFFSQKTTFTSFENIIITIK